MRSTLHKLAVLLFAVLFVCVLPACMSVAAGGDASVARGPMSEMSDAKEAPPPQPPGRYADESGGEMDQRLAVNGTVPGPAPTASSGPESGFDRAAILIYTGTFSLAVIDVAESLRTVETVAREAGGFFSRRDDHSITIRVPFRRFDDVVRRIEALGEMLHRNVTVDDVTEEFTDLATRLKSARAVRDRLKDLLTKATKVEDSLAIERELARLETEIDRMETRYEYLKSRAMFSTITVDLQPKHFETDHAPFKIPVDWLDHLGLGRLLELK